ncbi:hypothetical protein OIU11_01975 [Bacillus cereus]|uniref:nSTAND3 domain-containing NTPase n=1 Tax=Bacillus cereus TaxID=1396 RepID=UPI002226D384|nr:hypothetical protein [Bacillus cereus]UYY94326.1 hypothetical protein OIU11_01975 [Bacillus cereus]
MEYYIREKMWAGLKMDKYNMHLLGWKAFENLCTNIMQYIFGATYTPFSEGRDGGRDGYFEGEGNLNVNDKPLKGKFVFQCKHTSKTGKAFTLAIVKDEIPKITELVESMGIEHYIIFTNYDLSAGNDKEIKKEFLKISGLKSCTILGREWFESIIDANKFLRRLVPRLYGIGDLSEIIDERVHEQSKELLEELRANVLSFVSTKSYQSALKGIVDKRFVILLGPPAVGKTAIAATLCMTAIAEDESRETIILNDASEFRKYWNPSNPQKIYWFDDAFGTTNLDNFLLNQWERNFPLLNVALKKGATIIFTSRDYIFKEAQTKIKESVFPLLFDSQVHINVQDLTNSEREQILYNHIKSGDLNKETKKKLKPFLEEVAAHENFSPELARRLGTSVFHKSLAMNKESLNEFFSKPVHFFENVIGSLDENKKAALTLILMHGNYLPSPVREEHLSRAFKESFSSSLPEIRSSLNVMKDSLVKLSIVSGSQLWSLFHPSMLDSLQAILAKNPEMFELFLVGANSRTILRDVSCLEREHKIFVPEEFWNVLTVKLFELELNSFEKEILIRFFLHETPDNFLHWFREQEYKQLFALVQQPFTQFSFGSAYKFAYRLQNLGLLNEELRSIIVEDVKKIAIATCDLTFTSDKTIRLFLNEEDVESILLEFKELGAEHFMNKFDALMENINESEDDVEEIVSEWSDSVELFLEELETRSSLTAEEKESFDKILHDASMNVRDYILELQAYQYEEDFDGEDFSQYDVLETQHRGNIFSDVDE